MTRGKIERYHRSMKNRILLDNYYLPGQLEQSIEEFVRYTGGQVQLLFASLPSSIEYIKTGKLRGLAVTSAMRSEASPDLPTVAEFVPGYEVSSWYGIGSPKNTPADVVQTLNEERSMPALLIPS